MEPIVIKIHSFIDLITNSSTEIFIQTHEKTLDATKDLVNKILLAAGRSEKAEDFFDFKVIENLNYEEYRKDYESDEEYFEENSNPDDGDYVDGDIVLTPKNNNKKTINLADEVKKIFNIDGQYN